MSERKYVCIDLKSFYASVECVERGLDALKTYLVVADESRTDKTICLAVSPALKAFGIPGRPRLFEVAQRVQEVNRQQPKLQLDYIVAKPRMALYIEYSTRIFGIYLRRVAPEDIHVYSVDEVFIDVTNYLATYKMTAHELAMAMIRDVLRETGITATAGIGTNLYLAKVAMDIVAKRMPADEDGVRIAELDEMSFRQRLWNHRPLTDFWRMGHGIAFRLEMFGIITMGELARRSLTHEDWLYKEFGVNAELIIDHAWGWEPTTIADIKAYRPEVNSLSSGQVLQCPYTADKARTVVSEMADQLSLDLVESHRVAAGVSVYIGYDRESLSNGEIAGNYNGPVSVDRYGRHVPKPVNASARMPMLTSSSHLITSMALKIFDSIVNKNLLVRRINITMNNVIDESEAAKQKNAPQQLDLFADYDETKQVTDEIESKLDQEHRMQKAMLAIKKQFGKNAILRGTSFTEGATARERNQQIGGHKA